MTGPRARTRVLRRRLATQRLTSAPLSRAGDVVRLLGAVQAQERDHALYSLALRTRGATYASVRAELDAGAFLRTHVLRPTWHFVAPEDLRWMLAVTSPRVERGMAGRHRQLGLDDRLLGRTLDAVLELLRGKNFLTRQELGTQLSGRRGVAQAGQQLGHALLVAELRGLICSGPTRGVQHSYAVLDERVPPIREPDAEEGVVELVHRFFRGHGPAAVKDFTRWSSLTVAHTDAALTKLGGALDVVTVDDVPQWFDPSVTARTTAPRRAYLLPLYDEATLTYPRLNFPAVPGHPHGIESTWGAFSFEGGIIADERNIGTWRRTVAKDTVTVRTDLAPDAEPDQRELVHAAAQRLADVYERTLTPHATDPRAANSSF